MPVKYRDWARQFDVLNPGWESRLWDEREFIGLFSAGDYTLLKSCYERAETLAGKADIARLLIIHHVGGLYLDTDYRPLRAVEPLLHDSSCVLFKANPAKGIVTNSIFAAVAGHQFTATVLARFHGAFHPTRPNLSGPHLFTEVANGRGDVRIMESRIHAPLPYPESGKLSELLDYPESYLVHHFAASWVGKK